ncbi:hypothetical protein [Bradyrhizobium sp. 131]|uniref:hypothetical protein n=1 Tax=Bradyrhizobium sp. 131 TaxID=2782609 RepID=UPI001FFEBA7F|nr:hypothetical protein [Bradyrhizobium sp. 131]UPK20503.1 hypothetical protein IVA73_05420 [Bradyrhizobium sp. 131]
MAPNGHSIFRHWKTGDAAGDFAAAGADLADGLLAVLGFRPGRSAHDAMLTLRNGFMEQGLRWVVDVDISKYSDTIDHPHRADSSTSVPRTAPSGR